MNFNSLARRIFLGLLSLLVACPAKAAFLEWQLDQSSGQAADQGAALPKDGPAAEQGTSSSANTSPSRTSSSWPAQAQPPTESNKKAETQKQEDQATGTSFKRMFLNIPGDQK